MKRSIVAKPHFAPCAIAATMLLGALMRWPYEYYWLLRWAVCAAAVFVTYRAYTSRHFGAACIFALIAIGINPINPVHLTRNIWCTLDVIGAIAFILAIVIFDFRWPEKESDQGAKD